VLKIADPDSGLDPAYFDILAKAERPFGERSTLRLTTILAADNSLLFDDIGEDVSDGDFIDAYAWAELETDISPFLRLSTMAYAGHLSRDKLAFEDDGLRLQADIEDDRDFGFLGLQQSIDWEPRDDLRLIAGYDARRLDASYRYEGYSAFSDFAFADVLELPRVRIFDSDFDVDGAAYGAYFTLQKDLSDRVTAEIGARWDRQTYTGLDDDDQFGPRLNLLYRATDRTHLKLAWGRFYQAQEINQLDVADGVEAFFPAQLAEQAVIALEHRTEAGIQLRAEAYDKHYDDVRPYFENLFREQELINELEGDRIRVAPDAARARGLELSARGSTAGEISWWANYVWSKSEEQFGDRWVPRSWDQRHAVSAGVNFPIESWSITLAWRYHSGWPRTPVGRTEALLLGQFPAQVLDIGERNSDRWGVYNRVDLRASRDIPVSNGRLRFYVEALNLFNRNNEGCLSHYVVSTNSGIRTFENVEYWLPFIPSLGAKWEF
jgi:outer membrane receptor protein involved in Fe transport